jgi:ADP-ribose pyrophosphatase
MSLGNEPSEVIKQRLFYQGRKFNFEVTPKDPPNSAS